MKDNISFGKRPGNPLAKRLWKDIIRDRKRYIMIFLMLVATVGFVSGMYVANNSMLTTLNDNYTLLKLEDGNFELSETLDSAAVKAIESGEKADVVSVFKKRAYDEAVPEIRESVDEAVRKTVEDRVRDAIRTKVETEVDKQLAPMAAMTGGVISDDVRTKAVDEAYDAAMKSSFEDAVNDAYDEAKKSDEYNDKLSEVLDKAKKEIDKKVDEKYEELSERYELDDESFTPAAVKLYPLFCREDDEAVGSRSTGKIRVFSERREVDLYDILDGHKPENANEIIIDRMHADNADIRIGDTLKVGTVDFKVCGLAAFVDYSTLYENNNDTMFDALTFDIGMSTDEGFERINGTIRYKYAFTYINKPNGDHEEKTYSDNFLKALITQTAAADGEPEIEDYVPGYANHAVTFAPEDFGSDKAMGGVLLYILTAVLAFVFAVTISSALEKEATVIGTLRSLGYTKGELVRYYMSAPMIVIFVSAIVGNILGYTVFKNTVVSMYYNSYSLPTYKTLWTPVAFVKTTVVPIILMFVINLVIITKTLKLPPLRFLRRDLKKVKRSKAVRLPRWSFLRRFRLRVFIQNIPNYLMLFVGVCFVMLLLSMAVGMPSTLKYYQDSVKDMMFAEEQLLLTDTQDEDGNEITTSAEGAERFSINSLELKNDKYTEEVSIYGVNENSRYISLDSSLYKDDDASLVYISEAYSEKFNVHEGDTITLSEKYENKTYTWKVYGVYDYTAGIAVFMPNDSFNEVFERDKGDFGGYMSNVPITDIDEDYIAKRITSDDIAKLARQLDHSMGSYMKYFQYVCVIVAGIIIYLLTKIIIEKNEVSIAMTKILGYTDGEIASLYLITTGIVVLISEFAAIFVGFETMTLFWKIMMMSLGGWFAFVMTPGGFVKEFVLVFAAYAIIAVIDFIRVKNIPKTLALKNVE